MKLSASMNRKVKRLAEQGMNTGILKTYLFAKFYGHPTEYFPPEYCIDVTKSEISVTKVDDSFIKSWVKLWPTPAQMRANGANVTYSISGNLPECRRRMAKFLTQWDEYVEQDVEIPTKYELITQATEAYLIKQEDRNWQYTKKNHKFILDQDGSTLAQEIAELGVEIQPSNFYA